MKVLESQSAVLSNYEVFAHLAQTAARLRTTPQTHQNVSTVLKELNDYLTPPPTSRNPIPRYSHPSYNTNAIRTLLTRLKPYNLAKSEVLMIFNLRPDSIPLLDCVVEECDERFSAEQQEKILGILGEVLGSGGDGEFGNGVEGGGEVGAGQADVKGD